jgi:hypothetical protein
MATAEKQAPPKIDLNACRDYIHKLRTGELIPLLRTGDDPNRRRPSFPDEYLKVVRLIESMVIKTGDVRQVQAKIKTAVKEVPGFAECCEEPAKKQEQALKIEPVTPPLPADVALPPEASKGACKWHDDYVKFSKERSPRSFQGFHEANGWALLSTVAKRRIVLDDLGAPKYTPLFTAIVARSSIASKTEAARVFIAVLDKAELKWMLGPDEMTPQAMIDHMKEVTFIDVKDMPEDRIELERNLAFAGQLGWFYEEFGEHIEAICAKNSIMAPFKGIIRRMDDCHDEYKRKTISHKEQIVRDPYLSLLACMTPLDLKPYAGIDSPFWTNGFFARFAFIVPDTEEENNARFPTGNLYKAVPDDLTNPLKAWHERLGQRTIEFEDVYDKSEKGEDKLKGYRVIHWGLPKAECKLTSKAMDAFYKYGDALKAIVKREKLEHFEGNYIRFPMMAMRIAMICASLENNGLIEIRHWAKGQEFAEQARQGLHHLWIELNKNSFAQERVRLEEEVCKYIGEQKTYVSVRMLIRGKFRNHTAEELNPIIDNLVSSGDLVKHPPVRGGGKYFTVPGKEGCDLPDLAKKSQTEGGK